ncbi:MAG: radical SAM protein [Elusimicrobia bacterium]|nr:radical SAM protein [Elusimicrobiota bacterium]
MKNPGDILLISCYELGCQPAGLAAAAASLREIGFSPEILDLSVQAFDPERARRARFAGISVPMHTALRLGVKTARRFRELNAGCHICFFGLYAQLNAEYLLEETADSVIGGEYGAPLRTWVGQLAHGKNGPVPGLSLKGRLSAPHLERAPSAAPDRDLLPSLERYARLEYQGERRLVGAVEASRGCKHWCRHCPIPPVYGGRFYAVAPDSVVSDIRELARRGARHIHFTDPDFLNGPAHALRIARALHEAFPEMTYDFTAKVEHILKQRPLFKELAAMGCLFVVTALESLSDRVLENLDKGHTRGDILRALAVLKEAGIAMRPSFVAFTPWTSLEDYIDMLDVIEHEGLIGHVDPVQLSIRLLIPPGSLLLGVEALKPFLGALRQENFAYDWKHLDPRMEDLWKSVWGLVEDAAKRGEEAERTFYRIREKALSIRDNRLPAQTAVYPQRPESRPPRLSEAWFCCAEPTDAQIEIVEG